jgi:23S rRNA G2069 N7-methylase RlmK/C1962 C5-methylase RlmI
MCQRRAPAYQPISGRLHRPAPRARPGLRLRASAGAASDHPVLPAFPEGRYLKFLMFDV